MVNVKFWFIVEDYKERIGKLISFVEMLYENKQLERAEKYDIWIEEVIENLDNKLWEFEAESNDPAAEQGIEDFEFGEEEMVTEKNYSVEQLQHMTAD